MDRICIAVLEKILSLSALGRYVVFSEDELLDFFPDGEEKKESVLKDALKALKEDGFIDLKYSSGNLFCIAPLKEYTPLPELPLTAEKPAEEKKPEKSGFKEFMWAFAGGALGSLIVGLAFVLTNAF